MNVRRGNHTHRIWTCGSCGQSKPVSKLLRGAVKCDVCGAKARVAGSGDAKASLGGAPAKRG